MPKIILYILKRYAKYFYKLLLLSYSVFCLYFSYYNPYIRLTFRYLLAVTIQRNLSYTLQRYGIGIANLAIQICTLHTGPIKSPSAAFGIAIRLNSRSTDCIKLRKYAIGIGVLFLQNASYIHKL